MQPLCMGQLLKFIKNLLDLKVIFTKICRYQKNVLFLYCFSNLWHVKYIFKMKNKDNYIKIVYHHIHGDLYKSYNDRSFHLDFPRVHLLFTLDHCLNVTIFDNNGHPITIWKDKHGNIICRMLQHYKQTKINF